MSERDQLAFELGAATPSPTPDLLERYQAGLRLLRELGDPEERVELLAAIVWPRSPRLRGALDSPGSFATYDERSTDG